MLRGRRKTERVAKTGWCLAVCLAVGGGGEEGGHGLKFGKHSCALLISQDIEEERHGYDLFFDQNRILVTIVFIKALV